jgi:hypothetical protein
MRLPLIALYSMLLAGTAPAAPAVVYPGDPGAPVKFEHAEIVSAKFPALWVMSTRASAHLPGHEPHRSIDGNAATDWRVSGPPPAPMVRGNWLEIELNENAIIPSIEVHWLGDAHYDYKVYKKPRDDFREQVCEGRSAGGGKGLEKIELPAGILTRVIRVEFATAADNAVQGIREIRIGGATFPASYPPAADKFAPVEPARRILYVEFERLPWVTVFNPKIPHADGGTALRLMPRDDAFEGGHADLTVAMTPGKANWITLKLWESHDVSMTQRGDLIVVETLEGDATQRGRTFWPKLVTEQQHIEQDWYGPKPQPGRWSYVHYQLPAEVVGNRTELKLRLQGVGNARRDYPMRSPAPPIYSVTAGTAPAID